ncbi:MAG: T9SS type A sorting domain-containing protein [Bacteroidetes bacterium]|nr:T9SS type A sorting domain-containing protein [Bacteroidota bacterium]MBU2585433.1 T9SS type A sorting domain-containing protein [Bacteroidota bacterium]
MRYILIPIILMFNCSLFGQTISTKFSKWQIPSFFRGFNVLNEFPKSNQDIVELKASGANYAQLGCFGFQDVDSPYTIKQNYIDEIDSLVKYCRSARIYYSIAVRQGPGRRDVYLESAGLAPKSTIWKRLDQQKLYASMLKHIVTRYLPDSLFVAIIPIVEPNPLFDYVAYPPELLKNKLDAEGIIMKNIYSILIDSIRVVSTDIPVVVQNVSYTSAEYFSILEPQTDPFIIYEFHSYRPQAYTKEASPNTKTFPGMFLSIEWSLNMYHDKNFFKTTIYEYVLAFQDSHHVPISMGEFGLMKQQMGGIQFLTDISEIALERGWHFAYWDWRRGDGLWNYELMGTDYWNAVKTSFTKPVTSVKQEYELIVKDFRLSSYPNPFNAKTKIRISAAKKDFVTIKLFDLLGQEISTIYKGNILPGQFEVELDTGGMNLASNVYFITMTVGHSTQKLMVHKIVLLK